MTREVSFTSAGIRLAGTMVLPDAEEPAAVLLLPGSGKTDRDDNAPRLRIDVLRQVAATLAARGFASLRFDKRGVGASEGDYWRAGFHDRVADAGEALDWLRSQRGVDRDRVFVLGHSEGALIATRLAASGEHVAGVILLAGSARSGEATLAWQAQRIAGTVTGIDRRLIDALHIDVSASQRKSLDRIKRTDRDWIRVQLVQKVNAKWMREFLAYDPADDFPGIRVPVLAITGAKDIQVDPADLQAMARLITGDFEAHEPADVTHLLRADAGAPSLSTYGAQARRPVDPRILGLVGDWLTRHT